MMAQSSLSASAPAKVNLYLHVGPLKENGRHDLDSLVVFSDARAADRLTVLPSETLQLEVTGPYADQAGAVNDNLVLRAALALKAASAAQAGAKLQLEKNLPVAAGIGGGSSDAAAALHLLTDFWGIAPSLAADLAPSLGGDVPVALAGVPALMRGEGERVAQVKAGFQLPALLINPGVPCQTGAIFRAYDQAGGGKGFSEIDPFPDFEDKAELCHWLRQQRNDLEPAAIRLVPQIADVLSFLNARPDMLLARMSGSGATCFGLFETIEAAETAAQAYRAQCAAQPGWAVACYLGGRD